MKYDYVEFFENRLKQISRAPRILDAGGGRPFQKYLAAYRDWFSKSIYETLDINAAYNPTILGDIHDIPLESGSVEAVLCMSVLEHLPDPAKAVGEMFRVLKKGGQLLVYTHFIYPYHAREGAYGDYYRFTEMALRHLFRDFSSVELKKQGGYFRAMMFFLPFQAKLKRFLEPVAYVLDKLLGTERRTTTSGFYIYCLK